MSQESTIDKPSSLRRAGCWAMPAVLAAGLAVSACSSGQSVTGTANGTNYSAAAGKLPAGFPSDIPTPSNSRVLGGGGVGSNWDVAFAVTGSVGDGITAYQSKLRSAGYTISNTQGGAAGPGAAGAFTATSSKWVGHATAGGSTTTAPGSALKSGEFALNVTAQPSSGVTPSP